MNKTGPGGAASAVRAFRHMELGCGDHEIAYRTGLSLEQVSDLRERLTELGMFDTEALPLDEVSHG